MEKSLVLKELANTTLSFKDKWEYFYNICGF